MSDDNKKLRGRIVRFDMDEGFGFIYTDDWSDIFFSTYDFLTTKDEKHARVGSIVEFYVADSRGHLQAREIQVIEVYPSGEEIQMPNGKFLHLRALKKFGITSGRSALKLVNVSEEELIAHGHSVYECRFLFFSTSIGEYRFFSEDSFIEGDGHCNIDKCYDELKRKLLFLDQEA
ncbi:cold-shock protein [Butyrivibrio sp. FCS014]|uniref:cold-shock protein n=1 Tax=Butyrivibrio sp. FCS014 TaxID=1408304 RepID=UPI0004634F41|nr:cold shock domain-containing protein [Butyrivibrio sp. FCS014]